MERHGIIPFVLPVHIAAGVLALVFGYVALYAAKGATVHRRSGLFFVYAMLVMSSLGALIDAVDSWQISVNVIAGSITFYFALTGMLTVRRPARAPEWLDAAAMLFAFTLAVFAFKTGLGLLGSGRPETAPMFIFGAVAMLGAAGDLRVLRRGGIQGRPRLARHLWRLCFAMWVAAASFFWGPPNRVPAVIRIPALLPIPVLIPVFAMLYWLWRIRRKGALSLP